MIDLISALWSCSLDVSKRASCAFYTGAMLEADGLEQEILGERKSLAQDVIRELREIAKLGVPLALSSASGTLNMLVSSVLLGRLDTIALAAVSVSGIWTDLPRKTGREFFSVLVEAVLKKTQPCLDCHLCKLVMLVTFSSKTFGFSALCLCCGRTSVTDVLFFSGSQVLDRKHFQSFFRVVSVSLSFLCGLVSIDKNWILISFSYIPAEGLGQLSMFCSQAFGAGNYALVGSSSILKNNMFSISSVKTV